MGTDANAAEMQEPMSWAKRWRTVQGVLRMMRVLEVHLDEFVWQDRLDQMNHTPWLPPCFTVDIQVVFIYECQPCTDSVGFDTIMHIASILSKGRKILFQGRRGGIYFPWIIQGK